jgi:hypothetical protein
MSELNEGIQPEPTGQTVSDPPAGATTATDPKGAEGQAGSQGSAGAGQATGTQAEDTFFDPSKLPPELMPAYKAMQAAYTKKTQAIAADRRKIEAYDAFSRDPITNLQQIAQQYGYTMTKGEARQILANQQQGPAAASKSNEPWQPQSWDEVLERAEQRAMEKLMAQFAPYMQNVQKLQANNIEHQLSQIDPQWHLYEDEMRQNLAKHPSMAEDVNLLYRMSVPEEVYSSRAVQAALKKLESATKAAAVGSKSQTSKAAPAPRTAKTFAEAVEIAKEQLARSGG